MTSRDFCYWLQGYFEIQDAAKASAEGTICVGGLSNEQAHMIRKHLALVFKHEIDPSYPNQPALNAIHNKVPPHLVKKPPGSDTHDGGFEGAIRC